MTGSATGRGLYTYAISRGLTPEDLAGRTGIDRAPLRLVERGPLVALVSEVDLAEFGEEGLRRNLEDLAWLERVAVAHDTVARAAAERAPTAPLRLATIFVEEASLGAQLEQWEEQATRALDRIEGCSEWSVKAYADPAPAPEPAAPASARGDTSAGAGRAYLLQRRAATQHKAAGAEADAAIARDLHEALHEHVVTGRLLAAQDKRLSGHLGEMILNGTYLVADERVETFRAAVDRLAGEHDHVRVEVGGPWPPYSFATLETT